MSQGSPLGRKVGELQWRLCLSSTPGDKATSLYWMKWQVPWVCTKEGFQLWMQSVVCLSYFRAPPLPRVVETLPVLPPALLAPLPPQLPPESQSPYPVQQAPTTVTNTLSSSTADRGVPESSESLELEITVSSRGDTQVVDGKNKSSLFALTLYQPMRHELPYAHKNLYGGFNTRR